MATTSSLQNINSLPASKKVWAAYVKYKMSVVTVYIPSPYNVFLYLLEGQVHKDKMLGIMTNVGQTRLVRVIFTNIHKIRDACTVLVDASWLHNIWEMFLLFIKFKFLWKMVFTRKLKLIYPSTSQHYKNCSVPTFLILFKKILDPPAFKKEGRYYAFYMRDYKERK